MSFGGDAIEALRQALTLSPENVPLRRHLAAVLAQAQRWSEAEAELQEALRLDPGNGATRVALGVGSRRSPGFDPSTGRERVPLSEEDASGEPLIQPEAPTISFTDVGGLEGLKEE